MEEGSLATDYVTDVTDVKKQEEIVIVATVSSVGARNPVSMRFWVE